MKSVLIVTAFFSLSIATNRRTQAIIKPQYVDALPKQFKGPGVPAVNDLLDKKDERGKLATILDMLDLQAIYDTKRDLRVLSGGELQRFAIAVVCLQDAQGE